MSAPLVHAHDSRVHFILDEIKDDLEELRLEIVAVARAFPSDQVLADARIATMAVTKRRWEIAKEVAILREMLGVR